MPPPARPKKTLALTGIAALVGEFEDPKRQGLEKPAETSETRVPVGLETRDARLARIASEKKQRHAAKLQRQSETYDPKTDVNIPKDTDPYKTLFVGRLAYDADEDALRREFETFGDVRTVTIPVVRNDSKNENETRGRHCGYAFVEYAREDDMKAAYRGANGRTIEGRRVVVDAERGRAVPGWRPRRLGGGVGRGRLARPKKGSKPGFENREDDRAYGARGASQSNVARAPSSRRDGYGDRRDERSGRSDRRGYGDDGERQGYARGGSDRDWDRDRYRDRGYGYDRGYDRGYERNYGRDAGYDRRDSDRRRGGDGYKRDRSPDGRRGGYDEYDRGKRARDDGYGAPPPPPAAPDSPEEGEL